jgi:hypothetical protein
MRLSLNESIRNLHWSPDGRFAAFESYDTAGHSPMTTTHVWVVARDSGELHKVLLPEPNRHFSTYVERWTDARTLRIRTTLLDREEDVYFSYSSSTGQIEGPVG